MSKSLFERLGGRRGISTIVDDTVENHMNNTNVNARFLPLKEKPEQLNIIKNHTIDFFKLEVAALTIIKEKIWSLLILE